MYYAGGEGHSRRYETLVIDPCLTPTSTRSAPLDIFLARAMEEGGSRNKACRSGQIRDRSILAEDRWRGCPERATKCCGYRAFSVR